MKRKAARWPFRLPGFSKRAPAVKPKWPVRLWRGLWGLLLGAAALFGVGSLLLVLALRGWSLPASSVIVQNKFKALWDGGSVDYRWTPYAAISPHMALAVIAAEDQRFPDHHGFDLIEIREALDDQEQGRPTRGASTISQQVAKNLFLWSGRSFIRKGLEAWFTLLLEGLWPKQRILEVYLNIAEFGRYTFGVEAASRRFFDKPAARLTASEAARLAAVLPNPLRYRADKPSEYTLKRQRWIEGQMGRLGGLAYLDKL